MKFPYPLVLCDVGGTNARFAFQAEPDAPLEKPVHLQTADFPGLAEAFQAARPAMPGEVRTLIACAAGPVAGRTVQMTNIHWLIDGAAIAEHAGLAQGLLLNDFEAQALSLAALRPSDCLRIGPDIGTKKGGQLVLGPGTGLGTAALIEVEGRRLALPSEAGHLDLGPLGDEQQAIWAHMPETPFGRVSTETVISGPGLLRLHKARLAAKGLPIPAIDDPSLIASAKRDRAGEEAQTVRLFLELTARFAGNLTIAFLATGGVTFSGGMLPRLVDFIDHATFRTAFENQAPFGELMRGIDTRLITASDTVLNGMARIAAKPEDYAIDYAHRAWR